MREVHIGGNEAGSAWTSFSPKYMRKAPKVFFYKMLRKKNIVLNGKKAAGSEKLKEGDVVRLFLSQETIDRFSEDAPDTQAAGEKEASFRITEQEILYEDSHVLLLNKPAGILSQRADDRELSMTEYVIRYLLDSGQLGQDDLRTLRPLRLQPAGPEHERADRRRKEPGGAAGAEPPLSGPDAEEYYLCLVSGRVEEPGHIRGWLAKDERTNRVSVRPDREGGADRSSRPSTARSQYTDTRRFWKST